MSEFVALHEPCPCGKSSNAYCIREDGSGWCFSCSTNHRSSEAAVEHTEKKPKKKGKGAPLLMGPSKELVKRGIKRDTCEKYGYRTVEDEHGETVQVADYCDEHGTVVAQKVRNGAKEFHIRGDAKQMRLFGQHLWKTGGKRVIVTVGEIDALTVAQALVTWPVVSLPNGASNARKALEQSLEWLNSHDEVVLWFDNDEAGRKAVESVIDLFPPGKLRSVTTPGAKDASDLAQEGKWKEIVSASWEAKEVRPDGVINGAELWDVVQRDVPVGTPFPWPSLNGVLRGMQAGQVILFTAGSGQGKSALVREIAFNLAVQQKQRVGYIALEESVTRTARGFMALHLDKPIHLPGVTCSPEDLKAAFDATLGTGRFYLLDHFGSLDSDVLLSRMRFLVKGNGVRYIILDHVSIVISGSDEMDDERRSIDKLMTKLRQFSEETGAVLLLVSHLRRPAGDRGHEQGAETSLSQLRGSHSLAQLSDVVIGAERNGQHDDPDMRDVSVLRVLKNRTTGETGPTTALRYSKVTGRLREIPFNIGEDGEVVVETEAERVSDAF
jgi:twinkle protein